MVKDEDVCLHCGLCAERCPTGAWDMQKFLLEMTQAGARMPKPITAVNDFVVKFANVNGSGSASANELFAKSILRMGVPVASRNIFPSNIQGLPTWYEVRVSEAGHLGRRGGVDLMVAMNPQTWDQDVAAIEPGGYLFYEFDQAAAAVEVPRRHQRHRHAADRDLQRGLHRSAPAPAVQEHHLCRRARRRCSTWTWRRSRQLIGEQFKGKDKLIAAQSSRRCIWAATMRCKHLKCPLGLKVETRRRGRRPHLHRRQHRGGAGRGLWRRHGVRLVSDHALDLAGRGLHAALPALPHRPGRPARARYAIVQAEDELASIGIVIGAGWNGARAFTCTSGPGISLMQEFLGLAYFAEIPAVIFDVQRGGPSTGMPTRTQQSDILSCRLRLATATPSTCCCSRRIPRECFEMGALAFDLADRLQTPIFVMLDLDIGMNEWLCEPLRLGRQPAASTAAR